MIAQVYDKYCQKLDLYQKKIDLRQIIYDLLKNELKNDFDLFIVGSTHNQFALKTSDLDLCLVIYDAQGKVDHDYVKNNKLVIEKLKQIQDIILANDLSCKHDLYSQAVVPIFRFTHKSIEVDLNINRIVTIQNSFLLSCY